MTVPKASDINAHVRHTLTNIKIRLSSRGCAVSGYVNRMNIKLNINVGGMRDTTSAE